MKKDLLFAAAAVMALVSMPVQAQNSRIVEEGGSGPYKAIMMEEASLTTHTIFRPQDLSKFDKKNLLPIIVWGNGGCANSPSGHVNFLNEVASQGFLIVAIGPSNYQQQEAPRPGQTGDVPRMGQGGGFPGGGMPGGGMPPMGGMGGQRPQGAPGAGQGRPQGAPQGAPQGQGRPQGAPQGAPQGGFGGFGGMMGGGAPAAAAPATIKDTLEWHSVDSKLFNIKLIRFAQGTSNGQKRYGLIFNAFTVVNCEQDMVVRLAAGSNASSIWWVNGEKVLTLQADRRMVADDGMSKRITLKKGKNLVRAAVINGPGMSDMCARFYNEDGTIVKNITITNN